MNEPIASLMERRVWSIDMDDTVADIEALFADKGLTWAPVLESGRTVIGVIDLLQFRAHGREPAAARAWQLCTYRPITVAAHTPIAEVARLMVERRIHHVVVTEDDGIVGIVSSLDFVRRFAGD